MRLVRALRRLEDAVEGVVGEIALRAAGRLAHEPHRLELVKQVGGGLVDVEHAVDNLARGALAGRHQGQMLRLLGEIVGDAHRIDARPQQRLVGHALHAVPFTNTRGL